MVEHLLSILEHWGRQNKQKIVKSLTLNTVLTADLIFQLEGDGRDILFPKLSRLHTSSQFSIFML